MYREYIPSSVTATQNSSPRFVLSGSAGTSPSHHFSMKSFRTAKSRNRKRERDIDTELLIGCEEAEENLLKEEEIEQERNSRSWIKRCALLLYHLTKKETPGTTQGNSQIIKGLGLLHEVICNGNHRYTLVTFMR